MAKRRSNGEGTLRLRADGRWEMTIMDGFRDDGKRRFKTFYGKTQKEVKAKAKGYRDVPVPESVRPYAVKLRSTENKFVWEMKKRFMNMQATKALR